MENSKTLSRILIIVSILCAGYAIYSQTVVASKNKQISTLSRENDDLGDAKKRLAHKVSELEEDLSQVQHFDDDGSFSRGFSSAEGSISFTGSVYQGTIDGEFNGWEGETIFKMMDGSIWQQASYNYTYHYSYMPKVIIFNKNGTTYMKVEDVDDMIAVKRLR